MHFYDNLTGNIAHLFFEEWNNMGLCSEDDMEYIHDIIHDMILNFFDVFEFPHRSYNAYDDSPNSLCVSSHSQHMRIHDYIPLIFRESFSIGTYSSATM